MSGPSERTTSTARVPVLGRGARGPRALSALALPVAVGLAFADTSIVMLGLPEMYVELDASILGVSMVATAYNLVVAIAAFALLPVLRRVRPAPLAAAGLAVFGAASVGAGLAGDLATVVGFRAAQGLGGAMLLAASLPILGGLLGSAHVARVRWVLAGAVGAAVGPAVGGLLTEAFDWRAIFLVQAPVAALSLVAVLVPAARSIPAEGPRARASATARRANLGLVFIFGGLVGALFLAVIMVVTVWDLGPLTGAAVVSALPAAALVVAPLARRSEAAISAALGAGLLVLGLLALALLPSASVAWAVLALLVCGAGFGLVVPPLTGESIEDMRAPAATGSISVGARHVGLVLGLALIAPLLGMGLDAGGERATIDATAVVLDAPLPLAQKLPVAQDLAAEFERTPDGAIPDLTAPFDANGADRDAQVAGVRDDLSASIERALTGAFRDSYLAAAGIALIGLLVIGTGIGLRRPRHLSVAALAGGGLVVAGALVVVAELGLGGGGLGRAQAADACAPRREAVAPVDGVDATIQRIALDGLDGAACELGVSREQVVLSLAPEAPGAPDIGWDDATVERATRSGLVRAVDAAEDRGEVDGTTAVVLREASRRLPVEETIIAFTELRDIVDDADGRLDEVVRAVGDRLDALDAGDVLSLLGGLRP